MFGGIGYLLHGNMACGVHQEYLIVRVGPDNYSEVLAKEHARVFDIIGRLMTGWVRVAPAGCLTDENLQNWVKQGIEFTATLPVK